MKNKVHRSYKYYDVVKKNNVEASCMSSILVIVSQYGTWFVVKIVLISITKIFYKTNILIAKHLALKINIENNSRESDNYLLHVQYTYGDT